MKRLLNIVILFLVVAAPVAAQEPEPYRLYLPLVESGMPSCERTWRIVKPDGTSNEVLNPSGETTGNFAGAAVTRVTTYSHYGLYSYRLQTAAAGQGIVLTTAPLADDVHYVTLRVRGHLPPAWVLTVGVTTRSPRLIEAIDGDWSLYGALFTAAECNGRTSLSVTQSGAGTGDFYIDGVQVEANNYWTTYIDGTQEGCAWDGAEHASTSTRSAQSRAGGLVRDFWDYGFVVEQVIGVGAAPMLLDVRGYAILPGGELSGAKAESRQFTLVGRFVGDSEHDLHQKRQELVEELSIDTYPEKQAIRIRFTGATVQKQISAFYVGGLEADLKVSYGPWQVEGDEAWRKASYWTEKVAVQFLSPDPMWYEVGESAAELDTNDTDVFRVVAGRLKDTGQWDPLGPPDAAGTYGRILAVAEDATYIYFGGNFQNFDNLGGNADYIIRYHKQTGVYSPLSTGMDGIVYALTIGTDNRLWAGGSFANAGPVAAANVAVWDPVTETFAALGLGTNGTVLSMRFGPTGLLFICGSFTTAGGAGANRIASWDDATATWSPLGTGLVGGTPNELDIGRTNIVYVGGDFTQAGALAVNRLAQWDVATSTWAAVGEGMDDGVIQFILYDNDTGLVYISGSFTNGSGVPDMNRLVAFNGTAFFPLGDGMPDGSVIQLGLGVDGTLYASGTFTSAGGIVVADHLAKWNGASWSHLDLDLPGSPYVAVYVSKFHDAVVESKYNVYLGSNTAGVGAFGGLAVATNDGTQPAYPVIVYERTDEQPAAGATLETLRNERTGQELLFDYDLLPGEKLTIDLTPTNKSIVSSMFGNRLDAVLANSDFGTWSLLPGGQDVTSFVALAPGEWGDDDDQLSGWNGITGLTLGNTDNWLLYVEIVHDGVDYHINLYDDAARGDPADLVGHTAPDYTLTGLQTVVADAGSGLGGTIMVDAVVGPDNDIVVDFSSPVVTGKMQWKDTYRSLD